MAELVDALVSNTNGFGRAGSIPALGTKESKINFLLSFFYNNMGSLPLLRTETNSNFSAIENPYVFKLYGLA